MRKLWTGLGVFVLILLVIGVVVGAREMERNLEELTAIDAPVSEAAYEEINVIGTGLGVLKYLETGDLLYRERVENYADDFELFRAQYESLVET